MKFKIAKYKNFEEQHNKELEKTIKFLRNGDFKSADSKKLSNSNYFRAKIDIKGRLLFQFGYIDNEPYIFLLELLLNHEYESSQFLKGKKISEEDFVFDKANIEEHLPHEKFFHFSDNFIIFNKTQEDLLYANPPLIIVGSAGSGKTSVTIEKLRTLEGKVLYTSLSQELVNNANYICGEYKNIEFLSFEQFINDVEKQENKAIDFYTFKKWAYNNKVKEIEKYFEEFKGVLTAENNCEYISLNDYKKLGKNQSLFTENKREEVYGKFNQYLQFLKDNSLYDNNIAIYNLFGKTKEIYDFIVIDEIQDFTNKEIALILQSLKDKRNFIFSGDSNQIIYSNFFSWSHLKTMLYKNKTIDVPISILQENYRNSKKITKVANNLLKIKQLQFGSIDKESNYLIKTKSELEGNVHFYEATPKNIKEINQETENSRKVAVVVFDEITKNEIKKEFNTALIYTVQEIKGLEYEEVILVNFVSNNKEAFNEIIKNIQQDDLLADLKYNRLGRKDTENRLESYKIYINSLYVALTRGVRKLYILEKNNHRIFELLSIVQEEKKEIIVEQSSIEEWEKEAQKLEKLGKIEQVEEIRKKRLEKSNTVAEVINNKDIFQLKDEALNPKEFNKKAKDAFFEIVKEKNQLLFIEKLAELKYTPAKKYLENLKNKAPKIVQKKKIPKILDYAYFGNIKDMNTIILNKADLNFQSKDGETALMLASGKGYREIVQLLLDNGANPNLQRNSGETALFISSQFENKEIIKLLLDNNASIDTPREDGFSALMIASGKGNQEIVQLLLDNGANPNHECQNGKTPLRLSFEYDEQETMKLLLDSGANANHQNKEGMSILMLASANGSSEIVQLLLDNDANPNLQSKIGETALIAASVNGHKKIVQLLLNNNANVNLQKNDGKSALIFATKYEQKEIVQLLLDNKADSNLQSNEGFVPLLVATDNENIELVQLLLNYGANVDHQTDTGETPLMFAVENKPKEIVQLLLENGANPNTQREDGNTALSLASEYKLNEIIQLLLEHGADVNIQTKSRETASSIASRQKIQEVIKSLK